MTTIIVARSLNRVIGTDSHLPWNLPGDMKHFKELTTGNAVIMGRKTFESIGMVLPNRFNVVVSSDSSLQIDGVEVVSDLQTAIELAQRFCDEVFLIGGEQIFGEALARDLVDTIELTLVNAHLYGDTFFPLTPPTKWQVTDEIVYSKDVTGQEYDYAFLRYELCSDTRYSPLLYLPASRSNDQTVKMEQILNDGVCPFCPHWLSWYHDAPVEHNSEHWMITANDSPYDGAVLDLMLIPKEHVTNFNQLSVVAQQDFGVMVSWIIDKYQLDFAALGMRMGEMWHTGGSVAHLHAQFKVGDVHRPDFTPIRFKMSSQREENKPPTL